MLEVCRVFPYIAMGLDLVGNISLILQIVILFLLVLGLPLVRGIKTRKNLIRHGYLTVAALILHTILILIVMVPSFTSSLGEVGELSAISLFTVWSHAVLGTTAEVSGIILVGAWLSKPTSRMNCAKMKKWMTPTFIIWAISIINGAIVHILGLL
jgi:hypothetical protein